MQRSRRSGAVHVLPVLLLGVACSRDTEDWTARLVHADPFERELAAATLGECVGDQAPVAFGALVERYPDEARRPVRRRMQAALRKLVPHAFEGWLEGLGADAPDDGAAAWVVEVVDTRTDDVAETALRRRATNTELADRARARDAWLLAQLRDDDAEALQILVSLARAGDPDVQRLALAGLAAGDARGTAVAAVLDLARDADPELRARAVPIAAALYLRRVATLPTASGDALLAELDHDPAGVFARAFDRVAFARAFDRVAPVEGAPTGTVEEPRPEPASDAGRRVPKRAQLARLRDPAYTERARACLDVARRHPGEWLAIAQTLWDEHAAVRTSAALALAGIGRDDAAVPVLKRRVLLAPIPDRERLHDAWLLDLLRANDPTARAVLAQLGTSEDADVRRLARAALAAEQ